MTEPSRQDLAKMSPVTMIFGLGVWVVLFIGLIFGLVKCFSGDGVSSAQQQKYDECMEEKRKSGVDLLKRDQLCSYWKHQWKP
jgi:hypothetical protein